MMPARSAGIILYRLASGDLEVLLVHPGGPLWRNRHQGAWQMPKGHVEPGECDEAAARREVEEELGIAIGEALASLGEIRQAGGKAVMAYAVERDFDPSSLVSNTVEIAWPPRSGRRLLVPEIDEARWFALDEARQCILASQAPLIERLVSVLSGPKVLERPEAPAPVDARARCRGGARGNGSSWDI
jgi:predicted NUDIX family NTP pyrophosphohydrolase